MPAAQLAHSRSEGKPLSGRVADDGKNGNIGRKLNHEEQIARPRVKFQQARRQVFAHEKEPGGLAGARQQAHLGLEGPEWARLFGRAGIIY